ncbi:MAG: hypothetical protein ACRKFN_04885 [Desulfitobacterium sp.]
MMSLSEVRLAPVSLQQITAKQYLYKLKGHSGMVFILVAIQMLSILFSLGTRSSMSSSNEFLQVIVNSYSGEIFLIFSFIWMVVVASFLVSQPYQSIEFSVVNNRVTSHLSNILLIFTYAAFAGITSTLMAIPQRVLILMTLEESEFLFGGLQIVPGDLLLGSLVAFLYLLLFGATAYFIQTISLSLSKKLGIILWITLFAFGFGFIRIFAFQIGNLLNFYFRESSLGLFVGKVIGSIILLFGLSILISQRTEVKR